MFVDCRRKTNKTRNFAEFSPFFVSGCLSSVVYYVREFREFTAAEMRRESRYEKKIDFRPLLQRLLRRFYHRIHRSGPRVSSIFFLNVRDSANEPWRGRPQKSKSVFDVQSYKKREAGDINPGVSVIGCKWRISSAFPMDLCRLAQSFLTKATVEIRLFSIEGFLCRFTPTRGVFFIACFHNSSFVCWNFRRGWNWNLTFCWLEKIFTWQSGRKGYALWVWQSNILYRIKDLMIDYRNIDSTLHNICVGATQFINVNIQWRQVQQK